MKMLVVKTVLLWMLVGVGVAQAKTPVDELSNLGQLQTVAASFGKALTEGTQEAALLQLAHYGNSEYQAPELAEPLQPATGYEVVGHHERGESLYRIDLLEKQGDRGQLWSLLFYRAERHWWLVQVERSDNLFDAFTR